LALLRLCYDQSAPCGGRPTWLAPEQRVVRRWRWLFWLLLLAFAIGLVRVPLAVLQLSGRLAPEGPDWYVVLQGAIGVVQVGLAYTMFAGYRRSGRWGAF
jgi:hypothetical protein